MYTYRRQGLDYNLPVSLWGTLREFSATTAPLRQATSASPTDQACSPLHMTTTMATSSSSTQANAPHPMPPASADLATTWAFLEEGVDHIMTKLQTGVSYSKYMSLYTVAYNYCTSSRMHGTPDGTAGTGGRSESPFVFPSCHFSGKMPFPITLMAGLTTPKQLGPI